MHEVARRLRGISQADAGIVVRGERHAPEHCIRRRTLSMRATTPARPRL
jgi:hypothetical protein